MSGPAADGVVAGLRQLGKTVFLTTHYMDEAEYLADRITVVYLSLTAPASKKDQR